MNNQIIKIEKAEKPSLQDEVDGAILEGFMETVMSTPKVKSMIAKGVDKFNEFMGDDDKVIIIRRLKGRSGLVIVVDNANGEFEISRKEILDEEGNGTGNFKKTLAMDADNVINKYVIENFVEKLLRGELQDLL